MIGGTRVLPVARTSAVLSTVLVIPKRAVIDTMSPISGSPMIPLVFKYTDTDPITIDQNRGLFKKRNVDFIDYN